MPGGISSSRKNQGRIWERAERRGRMEKDGMGREIPGGFLHMHGAGLCDYDRFMRFLFLYMGVPAPRTVHSSNPDSLYVSGDSGDREAMPAVRYDTACHWKNNLSWRHALCDGSVFL